MVARVAEAIDYCIGHILLLLLLFFFLLFLFLLLFCLLSFLLIVIVFFSETHTNRIKYRHNLNYLYFFGAISTIVMTHENIIDHLI